MCVFSLSLSPFRLTLAYTFISALASVYNEKLLKSDNGSMHAANVQLYVFGVAINTLRVVYQVDSFDEVVVGMELPMTWVICFNMGNLGLVIAAVMKYHDNIVKILCLAVSNIIVFLYSVSVVHDQALTWTFVVGSACALAGVFIYQTKPEELLQNEGG